MILIFFFSSPGILPQAGRPGPDLGLGRLGCWTPSPGGRGGEPPGPDLGLGRLCIGSPEMLMGFALEAQKVDALCIGGPQASKATWPYGHMPIWPYGLVAQPSHAANPASQKAGSNT